LDFNAELYGEELEIVFAEKLRDEQKFPSVDALKAQIARDIERAKESL
jgi:riboflavin kinase/FMN adenylyltransferase